MDNVEYKQLIATIKFKVSRNADYYEVVKDFKAENYNVKRGALLLATQLTGEDKEEVYLSIIYKVLDNEKNMEDVEKLGEGIIKMTYDELAALLIAERIIAKYTSRFSDDTEIKQILEDYRRNIENIGD